MMTVPRAEDPARLALEGHDLHLGYAAGEDVVAGLDISVDEGSFTVIVGPNACGKSTLLRSLRYWAMGSSAPEGIAAPIGQDPRVSSASACPVPMTTMFVGAALIVLSPW